jgi:glycosyltransferase involved in cell wall biosynthesis
MRLKDEYRLEDKMIKVLHINSNYLTSKLHENLVDRLETEEMHNTIYMPIKQETKEHFLYDSKHEVYTPICFHNIDKYLFTWKQRKIYRKLKSTVNVNDISVTHAHTLFTDGNIAYQLFKEYGIPYIVTVRGNTDIHSFFKLRINLRNRGRRILKNASKVVFLSESNKRELLSTYIKSEDLKKDILSKTIVNPNGIDDFWFENVGEPKDLQTNKPLECVYVGKTMKLKNILGTIRALEVLEEKYGIKSRLTTVGKTLEADYAKKVIEDGKDRLQVVEQMSREELIHQYRKSDVFVMPSFKETFGLVYPEAMSQGLPVLYTKGQGFDQQFEDGVVGYPVDAYNPEDIADKIKLVMEDYNNISIRAIENFKKFNWDELAMVYKQVYIEII